MRGVVAKITCFMPPAAGVLEVIGMLETAAKLAGNTAESVKRALNAGSSQPGNMRRASATSNWVTSMRLLLAGGGLVVVAIDAAGRVRDRPGIGDGQRVAAGGDCVREMQRRRLQLFVQSDGRGRAVFEGGLLQRQAGLVEGDGVGRLAHVQIDGFLAGENRLLQVWRQVDAVGVRDDGLRKFSWRGVEVEGRFGVGGRGQQRGGEQEFAHVHFPRGGRAHVVQHVVEQPRG